MQDAVCLITGVGGATGAAIARRFARDGYRVAMFARNRERLERLKAEIAGSGAYVCDVGDLAALATSVNAVRANLGNPVFWSTTRCRRPSPRFSRRIRPHWKETSA
jgi:NADP-dependent 3-hydroxy acid dehydrogenase YdfG